MFEIEYKLNFAENKFPLEYTNWATLQQKNYILQYISTVYFGVYCALIEPKTVCRLENIIVISARVCVMVVFVCKNYMLHVVYDKRNIYTRLIWFRARRFIQNICKGVNENLDPSFERIDRFYVSEEISRVVTER